MCSQHSPFYLCIAVKSDSRQNDDKEIDEQQSQALVSLKKYIGRGGNIYFLNETRYSQKKKDGGESGALEG